MQYKPRACICGAIPEVFPKDPKTEGDAWGEVKCVNENCEAQPCVPDGEDVADDRDFRQIAVDKWNAWRSREEPTGIGLMSGAEFFNFDEPDFTLLTPQIIALTSARLPRWGAQFRPDVAWYSVAEHELLVCDLVKMRGGSIAAQFGALTHDIAEAFSGFGDVPTPRKPKWLHEAEERFTRQFYAAVFFTLAPNELQLIRDADHVAASIERKAILSNEHPYVGSHEFSEANLHCYMPDVAATHYLRKFERLNYGKTQ